VIEVGWSKEQRLKSTEACGGEGDDGGESLIGRGGESLIGRGGVREKLISRFLFSERG
jgi:hypothetical protein